MELEGLTFKGQCYDSGLNSTARCSLCGRGIRYVFVLKSPSTVTTGRCCIGRFKGKLREQLEAAYTWLMTTVEAEQKDIRIHARDPRKRIEAWRKLKHRALVKIRTYRRQTGKDWLPERLFELQTIVDKEPPVRVSARWYENRIRELEPRLG